MNARLSDSQRRPFQRVEKALQKHYSETRGSFLFFLNAGFKLVDRKAHFDQENA